VEEVVRLCIVMPFGPLELTEVEMRRIILRGLELGLMAPVGMRVECGERIS